MMASKRPVPVGVMCVVFDERSNWLLIRRTGAHGEGQWSGPGGSVEWGEHPDSTAVRETYEETGLIVGPPHFVTMTSDMFLDEDQQWVTLWFVAPRIGGSLVLAERECSASMWRPSWDLPENMFLPWQRVNVSDLVRAVELYELEDPFSHRV